MSAPTFLGIYRNGRNFGATFLDQSTGVNAGQLDFGSSGSVTVLAFAVCDSGGGLTQAGSMVVGSGGSAVTMTPRTDRNMGSEWGAAGRYRGFDAFGVTLTGLQDYRVNTVLVSDGVTPDNNSPIDLVIVLLEGGTALTSQNFTAVVKNVADVLSTSITSNVNSMAISVGIFEGAATLTNISPTVASTPGVAYIRSAFAMYRTGAAGATTVSATVGAAVAEFAGTTWTVEGSAGDITAPLITGPTGTGGTLVCSGSVSTDEANGTLYAVVTASATAPTAAQVKLGQDHTGAAALRVVSQAVTATGVQNIASGAVTAGTRFWHFMHEDAAANQSTVVSSASFVVTSGSSVTGAAVLGAVTSTGTITPGFGTFTSEPLKRNNDDDPIGVSALSWVAFRNAATGAHVVTKTGLSTNGSGIFTTTDPLLVAGTTYRADWLEASGQYGHGVKAAT